MRGFQEENEWGKRMIRCAVIWRYRKYLRTASTDAALAGKGQFLRNN